MYVYYYVSINIKYSCIMYTRLIREHAYTLSIHDVKK